jgi:hypothetical protein
LKILTMSFFSYKTCRRDRKGFIRIAALTSDQWPNRDIRG